MTKPAVLLSHEMLMPLEAVLAPSYRAVRLWDYPDRLDFLEGPGRGDRARGRIQLDPDFWRRCRG